MSICASFLSKRSWPLVFTDAVMVPTKGRLRFLFVSGPLRGLSCVCNKCSDKFLRCSNFCRYAWIISACPEQRFELDDKAVLKCSKSKYLNNSICRSSVWHSTETGWTLKPALENCLSGPTRVSRYLPQSIDRDQGERIGNRVDFSTCASLLRKCGNAKEASEGQRIHDYILRSGREQDCTLGNLLIQMYGKCEQLENAHDVFVHMYERNVFSWTIMIQILLENGITNKALQIFQQMEQEGVLPNNVSFIIIVSACDCESTLEEGKRIHVRIIIRAFEFDVVVSSALVNMYGKCGCVESSRSVFEKMPQRNVVSWNALIAAYSRSGDHRKVVELYQRMQSEGILPTNITFVTVLAACDGLSTLAAQDQIHASISGIGNDLNVVVGTALLNMYAKRGCLEAARKLFSILPECNAVSWNAMIAAYAEVGEAKEAFRLFQQMQLECTIPNRVTFLVILATCDDCEAVAQGIRIHALVAGCSLKSDIVIGNALIHMYANCSRLEDSHSILEEMAYRDVISWNAMIAAYVQHGRGREALQLFKQMFLEGVVPDKVTFATMLCVYASQSSLGEGLRMHARLLARGLESDEFLSKSLVNMYGKCGSLEAASRIFEELDKRDVVLWTAMISAFTQHAHGRMALHLYQQMKLEGVIPNKVTVVSILDACASHAGLAEGKRIHSGVITCNFESQVTVRNALINMYNKCGILNEAWNVFDKTPDRDVVTWTAMISGHAHYGLGKEADLLFQQMVKQVIPNRVTFINILDACSHAGLVNEGYHYFFSMSKDFGIMPAVEHYNCMIDLLGRAGRLQEGEQFIKGIHPPMVMPWMTLLNACKLHSDVELGKRAAEHICQLESGSIVPYTMLSNIQDNVSKIRMFDKYDL